MDIITEPLGFRCRFEKTGPIRFISHLDLTRTFHRAFSRAGIPLKFSDGFSPHPKFAFALPLSVGTESLTELADFTLKPGFETSPEALKEALQNQMPAGIRILKIEPKEGKFSEIAFASYTVSLPKLDPGLIHKIAKVLEGEILVTRKNKKGKWVEKDIAPGIQKVLPQAENGSVTLSLTLAASGENYLKPELVLKALEAGLPEGDFSERRILRTGVYLSDMTPF